MNYEQAWDKLKVWLKNKIEGPDYVYNSECEDGIILKKMERMQKQIYRDSVKEYYKQTRRQEDDKKGDTLDNHGAADEERGNDLPG